MRRGFFNIPGNWIALLNRKIDSATTLNILYDRSISSGEKAQELYVPLLRAQGVHRERGMVALLASKELTLKPLSEEKVTRVGENQLPAWVRQQIEKTVAHTFKYVEGEPRIKVKSTKPERKQGKFDAMVNTLISLGDVTLKGSTTVEVNVKSGSIMDLELALPKGLNVLSLSAPSLRTYKVNEKGEKYLTRPTIKMVKLS